MPWSGGGIEDKAGEEDGGSEREIEEREKDLEDQAGDLDAGTIEEDLVSSLCANLEENILISRMEDVEEDEGNAGLIESKEKKQSDSRKVKTNCSSFKLQQEPEP